MRVQARYELAAIYDRTSNGRRQPKAAAAAPRPNAPQAKP